MQICKNPCQDIYDANGIFKTCLTQHNFWDIEDLTIMFPIYHFFSIISLAHPGVSKIYWHLQWFLKLHCTPCLKLLIDGSLQRSEIRNIPSCLMRINNVVHVFSFTLAQLVTLLPIFLILFSILFSFVPFVSFFHFFLLLATNCTATHLLISTLHVPYLHILT